MTGSLVISIGCFREVFGDGTMQCIALRIRCYIYPRIVWDPRIILGLSWFNLIDCGVALALLEDKQSLVREDCNVPFI